jgi:hypothetical protein
MGNTYTVVDILKHIKNFAEDHEFYLDEPFLNGETMDKFHDTLLPMERDKYIKGYHGNLFEGVSKMYPSIPHVCLRIRILDKGLRLLKEHE